MSKQKSISTVTAKHHAEVKRGALHHITITPSDNGGATVEARFKEAPGAAQQGSGPRDNYVPYDVREAALNHTTTHEDGASALAQAGEHMGVKMAEDKDEDGE